MSVNVPFKLPIGKHNPSQNKTYTLKTKNENVDTSNIDQIPDSSGESYLKVSKEIDKNRKSFNIPLPPTSKSTTFEKKFKSRLALRESEYDKGLKRIKNKNDNIFHLPVNIENERYVQQKANTLNKNKESKMKFLNNLRERSRSNSRFVRGAQSRQSRSSLKSTPVNKEKLADMSQGYQQLKEFLNIQVQSQQRSQERLKSNNIMEEDIDIMISNVEMNLTSSDIDIINELDKTDKMLITNNTGNSFEKEGGQLESNYKEVRKKLNFTTQINEGLSTTNEPQKNSVKIQENINKINLGILTSTYENLKTNKEFIPKFDKVEYRRILTTMLRYEYGAKILEDMFKQDTAVESSLQNHEITERMRMRMVDWMIEVLSNYKCEESTFFTAVSIMDRYFREISPQNKLLPEDLHIIGICSMFLASKFCDVFPIKLKLIVEKVSHNKFQAEQVKQWEETIIKTLNYNIYLPTSFDFANYFIENIFYYPENNFHVTDESLCEYVRVLCSINEVKYDSWHYEKFKFHNKYTKNMINLLRMLMLYILKMNCHDYQLICVKPSLLAASSLFVAVKICEQINDEIYINDYFKESLREVSKHSEYDILHYAQAILYNAQNFELLYPHLENLKKVHFSIIQDLQLTK
jgi:hypothetical protein